MVSRLDKILSGMGYGSRKDIKNLAKYGAIKVNGVVEKDTSVKIDSRSDVIEIDGKTIEIWEDITIMLNKPAGYVSSNVWESDYPPVTELIDEIYADKLKVAGRLDVDSVGLLLLTTSGELIHKIIKPSKETEKKYLVKVTNFDRKNISYFHSGIEIENDFMTKPVTFFEILEENEDFSTILIGITEGKFHQVKRMFAHFDSEVIYLKRISIGGMKLDDDLPEGKWKKLDEKELNCLF